MAGALLSAIVERLGSIISSEVKLTVTVKEDVQKLETKFRTIQAVLNDAEKRQLKEEAVKLWLDKLEGVSYEIDDVLDEWNTVMIKAEIEKQQKEFEEEEKAETSTAKKKKVWPLISNFNFSVPNLLPHRDIAHKMKELNEKLDEINKEREVFGFELSMTIEEVDERSKTTSYVDVSDTHILGRDKVKNDLVSILLGKGTEKEKHPHVISLVGMGGIGKTTLAQLAFNHHEVKDHFHERIWVCVSEPFDQCRVAKAIVEALAGGDPKITELQSLLENICDLIVGKECFFVFDDVWTEDYAMWKPFRDALKSCGSQSSRILVTTRKEKVAKMMESTNTIKLEELSEEDCWLVFSKIAFFDKDPKQCEQLEDLGRQISKKCKGLPLAAKTLGSLMHFKKSREEWEMVLCSSMWELEDVESGLFVPLLLSYHDLPSPLKQCFLYCGVFPKDYVFSSGELVFMWMAQGYIKPKANMEIEIIAREYFENLAIRSFFQDFKKVEDDDKIIRCKMHDIVHDFAQLMSKNECIGSSGVELGLYYKNIHHLQVEIPKYSHFPEGVYNAKNLRTLILVYQNGYILSNIFRHFRCLRILTLTCQDDNTFKELPDAVGNFIHLRYLNLVNYCGYVLPETICNLCNLQILKISFGIARVKKLPQGMGKLTNLRHLTLDCLYFGLDLEFPIGFGRLVSLRTLSHFNISGKDDSEGCKLVELENLNHLQGALQIRRLGNVLDACEAEDAQLKKKTGLRTLFLRFDGSDCEDCEDIRNNDGLILNGLEPPPFLEYLCIEEYRATTMSTNWMMSLTNLKKLDIRYAFLEHLPPLGKLLFLESLHIDNAIYLKKVGVEFLGIESKKKKDNIIVFPSLKYLTFESLYEWKEWIGIGGEEEEEDCITIMPRLEKLTFRSCEMLLSLPDFLRKSPTKQLVIHNCCYLSKCCEEEEWPKIFHIPNIIIDYKYVQGGREYMPEPEQKIVMKVQMNSQKCQTKAVTAAAEANEGAEKDKVLVIGEGVDAISLAATMRRKADTEAISVAEVTHQTQSLQKLYLMACDCKPLEVEIESAQGLPYVNHFTDMKSYAVVYIWDIKKNLRSNKVPSSVYTADGSNPTWNFKVRFHIDLAIAKQNHYALVVKLKLRRRTHGLPDKYIGEVRVLITELLEGFGNAAEDKIRVKKNVQTSPEKFQGELAFSYIFGKPIADHLTEVNIAKKRSLKEVALKVGSFLTAIVL